jgi:hypothetical protein
VLRFPSEDHHAPSLEQILAFCEAAHMVLAGSPNPPPLFPGDSAPSSPRRGAALEPDPSPAVLERESSAYASSTPSYAEPMGRIRPATPAESMPLLVGSANGSAKSPSLSPDGSAPLSLGRNPASERGRRAASEGDHSRLALERESSLQLLMGGGEATDQDNLGDPSPCELGSDSGQDHVRDTSGGSHREISQAVLEREAPPLFIEGSDATEKDHGSGPSPRMQEDNLTGDLSPDLSPCAPGSSSGHDRVGDLSPRVAETIHDVSPCAQHSDHTGDLSPDLSPCAPGSDPLTAALAFHHATGASEHAVVTEHDALVPAEYRAVRPAERRLQEQAGAAAGMAEPRTLRPTEWGPAETERAAAGAGAGATADAGRVGMRQAGEMGEPQAAGMGEARVESVADAAPCSNGAYRGAGETRVGASASAASHDSADEWHAPGGDAPVLAVHCKAGKGRTGVMLAAYLMWASDHRTADGDAALAFFRRVRTSDGDAVVNPSQVRFFACTPYVSFPPPALPPTTISSPTFSTCFPQHKQGTLLSTCRRFHLPRAHPFVDPFPPAFPSTVSFPLLPSDYLTYSTSPPFSARSS